MKKSKWSPMQDQFTLEGCTYSVEVYSPDAWRNKRGRRYVHVSVSEQRSKYGGLTVVQDLTGDRLSPRGRGHLPMALHRSPFSGILHGTTWGTIVGILPSSEF